MAPKSSSLLVLLAAVVAVSATSKDIHAPLSDTFTLGHERLSCPKCDGIKYTANNGLCFKIECDEKYHGKPGSYEPPSFHVNSFEECIHECSKADTCKVASYKPDGHHPGGECYLRGPTTPDIPGTWDAVKYYENCPTPPNESSTQTETGTDSTTTDVSNPTTTTDAGEVTTTTDGGEPTITVTVSTSEDPNTTSEDSTPTTTEDSTPTTSEDSTPTTTPTGLPEIPGVCLTTIVGRELPQVCLDVCNEFLEIPLAPIPAFCQLIPEFSIPPLQNPIPTGLELPGFTGHSNIPDIPPVCLSAKEGSTLPRKCAKTCEKFLEIEDPTVPLPPFCLTIPALSLAPLDIPNITEDNLLMPGFTAPANNWPEIPEECLELGGHNFEQCRQCCIDYINIPNCPLPKFCYKIPGLSTLIPVQSPA